MPGIAETYKITCNFVADIAADAAALLSMMRQSNPPILEVLGHLQDMGANLRMAKRSLLGVQIELKCRDIRHIVDEDGNILFFRGRTLEFINVVNDSGTAAHAIIPISCDANSFVATRDGSDKPETFIIVQKP